MGRYVDDCISLEVLMQDSGLLPKPEEGWNTFVPNKDDIAFAAGVRYCFDGTRWVEAPEPNKD